MKTSMSYSIKRALKIAALSIAGYLTLTSSSCTKDPYDTPGSGTILVTNSEKTFGWGHGSINHDAYLSISATGGEVQSFRTINANDETTQNLVDVVFPGDWGSSGGAITICAPTEGGAGGASYELCKDWIRRRATKFVFLAANKFQKADFDNTTTVEQIQKIFTDNSSNTWTLDPDEHSSFAIKTYDGKYAIAYITDIRGAYGNDQSTISLIIKAQP